METLDVRIQKHTKEELIGLTHRAETQIARLGSGVFKFPTVRVERVAIGHHHLVPLADQPASEDVMAAASQVVEDIHRGDRLINLYRRFIDEIRMKTYGA